MQRKSRNAGLDPLPHGPPIPVLLWHSALLPPSALSLTPLTENKHQWESVASPAVGSACEHSPTVPPSLSAFKESLQFVNSLGQQLLVCVWH